MKKILIGVLFLFLISGSFFFGKIIKKHEVDVRRSVAAGDLSQLKLLLDLYFQDNGHYPSGQYQRNPSEPLHSWRLLLLPYMHEDWGKRYKNYDFSKEWNHPDNIDAMDGEVPALYQTVDSGSDFSNFILIKLDDEILSESFYTNCILVYSDANIVIIEDEDSSTHWMNPSNSK